MRTYMLSAAAAFAVVILMAQTPIARQNNSVETSNASPTLHDTVNSEKARRMINAYINNGRKADHKFTKFNRQDLIDALQSMPDVDTVKFVMGSFTDDDPGPKKGKPVIMLQLVEQGKPQPGGLALVYAYMRGNICPPPNGACAME